ncbi:hypothetical protein B0H14DRAFT_2605722 [Mycena olivaceomarginata]|nr:hypothetical protein B0H14DRAFT_2605722 [Mycena olivaceomarginata]
MLFQKKKKKKKKKKCRAATSPCVGVDVGANNTNTTSHFVSRPPPPHPILRSLGSIQNRGRLGSFQTRVFVFNQCCPSQGVVVLPPPGCHAQPGATIPLRQWSTSIFGASQPGGNEPFGTLTGIFSDWSATGLGSTYPLSNEPFGTVPGNYYDWNTITFGTGSWGMVQSTGTRVAWRIYIGDSFLWKAPSLAHVGPQWGDVQKLPIEAWLGQLPSDDPNESEDEAHIIIEPR